MRKKDGKLALAPKSSPRPKWERSTSSRGGEGARRWSGPTHRVPGGRNLGRPPGLFL